MSPDIVENVPLASRTTLGLGGPARFFVSARDEAELIAALRWARGRGMPSFILGGGSNLVVADRGFEGLVVHVATRGLQGLPAAAGHDAPIGLDVAAGEPWDDFVAATVAHGLAGLECLSGIPGQVGATPIQNVGAYGQEVAEAIHSVRVYDRRDDRIAELTAADCGFAYRSSRFRADPDRHAVLSIRFVLRAGGAPSVRYRELEQHLTGHDRPTLAEVRQAVIALRRSKSMVIDESDENRRSAGSFFTNPVLSTAQLQAVIARAQAAGLVTDPSQVPQFPAGPGQVKLAAGWLIERAGIHKGLRRGPVGISSRHALALVHHGGGTTAALLALAREVRQAVHDRFGVTLSPEPILLGVSL